MTDGPNLDDDLIKHNLDAMDLMKRILTLALAKIRGVENGIKEVKKDVQDAISKLDGDDG